MAEDEAIFESYIQGGSLPTLRIYGWHPAAVSLGYFQDPQKVLNLENCRQLGIPWVRRMTGGGAIFHQQEITYSISCNLKDLNFPRGVKESYRFLCRFLIDFYRRLGLRAVFACRLYKKNTDAFSHFCFSSFSSYDICIQGKKIGGNAQKRKRQFIFQHGSIPFFVDFSLLRAIISGFDEKIKGKVISLQGLKKDIGFFKAAKAISASFKETFSIDLSLGYLSKKEEILTKELAKEKYANNGYDRKTPKAAVA